VDCRNEKAASQRLAGYPAHLTRGFQYPNRLDTDYGLSVAPLAGVVVVPSVSVAGGVVVVVVVVSSASPLHPATTKAAIMIIIANKLLIARSPEIKVSQILAPDCRGIPLNMVQRRANV
jgi:hypothetical protein